MERPNSIIMPIYGLHAVGRLIPSSFILAGGVVALEAQDFGGPFLPVMCQPVWDWLLQHFSALVIAGP